MVNAEYWSLMPPCTPQNAPFWKINYMETLYIRGGRFGIENIKEKGIILKVDAQNLL